jgi:tyrosine-protein kinase Src
VALYNYNAREETDVSFVKGDRMEVMDDTESDWWRVVVCHRVLKRFMGFSFIFVSSAFNDSARRFNSVELRS